MKDTVKKNRTLHHGRLAGLLVAGGLFISAVVYANVPQPSCVLYGVVKSCYGWPIMEGEITVTLDDGTSFLSDIEILGPGINFILSMPLDDGVGIPYGETVAFQGEPFTVALSWMGLELGVIETNLPAVGGPGSVICMNVTAGTDTDQDGLPDEWELEFVANSGGAFTNINQIVRDDDYDGDGVDNYTEYLSGTLAFLDYDYFAVEQVAGQDKRIALTYFSELGFYYHPEVSESMSDQYQSWIDVPFSITPDGAWQTDALQGDFSYQTIYVSMTNVFRNIRLVVE